MLRSGADKICLNSALIENIKLLKLASKKFCSSTITAIVEISKIKEKLFITSNNGRELHYITPPPSNGLKNYKIKELVK